MSVPLSVKSVTSVMPLMLLASSMVQSWQRLSCWYCSGGSWMAWMSKLESTSFPTLSTQIKSVVLHQLHKFTLDFVSKPTSQCKKKFRMATFKSSLKSEKNMLFFLLVCTQE